MTSSHQSDRNDPKDPSGSNGSNGSNGSDGSGDFDGSVGSNGSDGSDSSGNSSEIFQLRNCRKSDLAQVQSIYEEQVLHGSASFEEIPPSLAEMTERWLSVTRKGYPYLVAVSNDTVVGYGYAVPYRPRSAYRHTAENSVYVHQEFRGRGLGKQLLLKVIARCELMNLRQLIGVVGDSENKGSIQLHLACGFRLVGTLERVGYKHNRWIDTVILQRSIDPVSDEILPRA